ncbi:MAG: hypothetical protein Q4C95_11825 [Planctomycetia bacterium]|nr:hypothetical protein [Planctomycetia bacterium]
MRYNKSKLIAIRNIYNNINNIISLREEKKRVEESREDKDITREISQKQSDDFWESFDANQADQNENITMVKRIIELWNVIFSGTPQYYRNEMMPDAITVLNAKKALQEYPNLEDFRIAFTEAKSDDFSWLLKDVLKPANLQRLLTKAEKRKEKKNENSVFGHDFVRPEYDQNEWRQIQVLDAITGERRFSTS